MKQKLLIIGLLLVVALASMGAVNRISARPPQTDYIVYADGREFRSDAVTVTADGLNIMGFWEKVGGRWYYRHYEGLRVRGDYILRQAIMRTQ